MKTLAFILVLIPSFAFCQLSEVPFKKANTIIIQTDDSPEDAYKKMARILTKNGYGIENSDNILLTLTTNEQGFRYGNTKLNVSIEENKIRLTGTYNTPAFPNDATTIDMRGMKKSPARLAFEQMNEVAKQYGAPVLYTIF